MMDEIVIEFLSVNSEGLHDWLSRDSVPCRCAALVESKGPDVSQEGTRKLNLCRSSVVCTPGWVESRGIPWQSSFEEVGNKTRRREAGYDQSPLGMGSLSAHLRLTSWTDCAPTLPVREKEKRVPVLHHVSSHVQQSHSTARNRGKV